MTSKRQKLKSKKMIDLLNYPEVQSWRAIMQAYQQIYRFLETELLKADCSIPRFQIFFYLYFQGPISSIDLANLMNVTRGNISTFLSRLIADELVYLSSGHGRGSKQFIHLSDRGIDLFESFFPAHIQRVISVAPKLSKSSLKSLNQVRIPD